MSKNKTAIVDAKVNENRLSINDYRQFIDCVTGSVLFDDELHLENLEPVFLMTILDMFTSTPLINKEFDDTDIDTIPVEQKKGKYQVIDFDASYKFCLDNGVLGQVKDVMGEDYINGLYQDCLDTLEFKKDMAINRASSVSDNVVIGIVGVLDAIHSAVENMDMGKSKEILDFVSKMKATPQDQWSETIVKNLPKKDVSKADNITPIEG